MTQQEYEKSRENVERAIKVFDRFSAAFARPTEEGISMFAVFGLRMLEVHRDALQSMLALCCDGSETDVQILNRSAQQAVPSLIVIKSVLKMKEEIDSNMGSILKETKFEGKPN